MQQLDHTLKLLDFFSYVALIAYKFVNDYIPMLKEEKDKSLKLRKSDLAKEMRGMLELYSTYQIDYDYFDYKTYEKFSLFIVSLLSIVRMCFIGKI